MKSPSYRLLQALLWFASLSHLIIGGGIMLSSDFQRAVAGLYGAEVEWSPQLTYILRPLGAFMFVLGVLVLVATRDPWRHRLIVHGLCGVLFLRVLQRLLLQQDIRDAFHIGLAQDLGMAGLFLVEALAILLLLHTAGARHDERWL
jgi:hypothetical protein